ncbi:nuclear receptor subfamily 1 group D member 2-like [Mercenaria mercenaria]|uniref:nuclear receptor subfamily 1 group D member 2-like n=1 Tax=Mercenaria mercenaria TaxID=6596 RepID=UPI00234F91E7|nr:nuclear receptor subfamily 1 group D member 2-like [Mercenaria mercenaria]
MMHSDGSDVGDVGFPWFSNLPTSPTECLGDFQSASVLSPLLLSPDTQNYLNEPLDEWQSVTDISPVEIEAHQISLYSPQAPLPTEEDYVITSLDGNNSTPNENSGYTSSDIPSPEASSSSYGSADSPEMAPNEISVTSRLKSVLMSRQKNKHLQLASSSQGTSTSTSSSSVHSYFSSDRKRNYESIRKVEEHNGDRNSVNTTLRFPPCCVCGGIASGLHYGINSCEPCKGFFTRYLRKKEEYKCAKDNNCPITNRLRGNCSACRLKKCLALGMARKNSRLGRYSLSRRMETIMQVNELEKQNARQCNGEVLIDLNATGIIDNVTNEAVSNTNSVSLNAEPTQKTDIKTNSHLRSFKFKAPSGFSHKLVKTLVQYMEMIKPYGEDIVSEDQIMNKLLSHYEAYQLKISIFGNLKSVPKNEYFNLLKGYGIEIDKRMMFLKQSANEMIDIIERYCNFAKQIPHFKALSSRDQTNLLKSSRYDFFMILMHGGYLHEKQVFLAHNGAAFHMEEVADKFFSRKLVINVCDMYHRLQNLKLSKEENALLIAISLVFTDRCSLENPGLVEQIQFSLTQLLQKQLERTCPSSAFKRFTKIIDCLTIMRESSELYLKEYSELCQDEMVIEEVPIMTELLFED